MHSHDDDEDSELTKLLKASQGRNYMTPACYSRLKAEQENLLYKERPHMTQVVAIAAANGDRSENADYLYGKRRLREIDSRLRFLARRLDKAVVIDPANIKTEKIQFGATVTVIGSDGKEKTYSIVGIDEVNVEKNWISWVSPIGHSLLGKIVGDEIKIQTPKGVIEVEITKIIYQSLV